MKKLYFIAILFAFSIFNNCFSQALIPYREGSLWGYCNSEKKVIIKLQFDDCTPFKYGYAKVKKNDKCGIIDSLGNEVYPCKYSDLAILSKNYVLVNEVTSATLRNMQNEIIQKCPDYFYNEGLIRISKLDAEGRNYLSGFIDGEGKEVIPCTLKSVSKFSEGLAAVRITEQYGNYGYIDKTGKLVIPEQFSDAKDFKDGYAFVKLNYKKAIIDKTGKTISCPVDCDAVSEFTEGIFVIKNSDGTYSAMNEKGETIIPAGKYASISNFRNGVATYTRKNESGITNFGLISKTGVEITPPVYGLLWHDDASGYYISLTSGVGTLIDEQGKEVYKGQYIYKGFINGLAEVSINNFKTYINKNGVAYYKDNYSIVKEVREDFVTVFREGRAFIGTKAGSYSARFRIIDTSLTYLHYNKDFIGGTLMGPRYYNGIATVFCNTDLTVSNIGFIDKNGNYITQCVYAPMSSSHFFDKEFAAVAINKKWGLINKEGKLIIPLKYDDISVYKDLIAVYFKNIDKWGIINNKDSVLVKPVFKKIDIQTDYQDYLPAQDSGTMKWGYINKKGAWVIKPIYDYANRFSDKGQSIVALNKKYGIINKTGAFVYQCQFEKIRRFSNGLIYFEKNNKYAIVDAKGAFLRNFQDSAKNEFTELSPKLIYDGKSKVYNEKMVEVFKMPDNYYPDWESYKNGYLKIKAKLPDDKGYYPVAVIDTKGKMKINPYEFDDIELDSEKFIPVKKNNKWGYIKIIL